MRTLLVACVMASVAVSGACAEQAPATPSVRQVELAHRYVLALHLDRTMEASLKAAMPAMMGALPGKPEEQKQMLEDATEALMHLRTKYYARIEPVIAGTFSESDLEGIVAFYEGPYGQALIAKQPEISAKMAPAMKELLPEYMAEIMTKVCARTKGCDPSSTPKTLAPKPS